MLGWETEIKDIAKYNIDLVVIIYIDEEAGITRKKR